MLRRTAVASGLAKRGLRNGRVDRVLVTVQARLFEQFRRCFRSILAHWIDPDPR
jgi:hypothetical protein